MMRIVAIGTSHWHTRLYVNPAMDMDGVEIVGVSDPDPLAAQNWAGMAKCRAWSDYREMCAQLRPDFAFALGKHSEMAEIADYLVGKKIPFAMEKPCGLTSAEISLVARRASDAGIFAAAAFVMRHSPMLKSIREVADGEAFHYLSCRFIGGLAQRYRQWNSDWMLDRATAGGGCMVNLGIHCIDLCNALLAPQVPTVVGAMMSNSLAGCNVEDYGLITMRSGDTCCHVESGYAYPAERGAYDMHLSFRTSKHYFIAHDADTFEIIDDNLNRQILSYQTTNVSFYPTFVRDVLRRVEHGEPPIASLYDAAAAMKVIEAGYALAPLTSRTPVI